MKKGVKARLFVIIWGIVAGITGMLIIQQPSDPVAQDYMAKVEAMKSQKLSKN